MPSQGQIQEEKQWIGLFVTCTHVTVKGNFSLLMLRRSSVSAVRMSAGHFSTSEMLHDQGWKSNLNFVLGPWKQILKMY